MTKILDVFRFLNSKKICDSIFGIAAVCGVSTSFAAQIQASDLAKLQKEAAAHGAVRVLISLNETISLKVMQTASPAALLTLTQNISKPLIVELGANALAVGRWNNGLGQIGLIVTPAGLSVLAKSSNAKFFIADPTDKFRIRVPDLDGSLDAIEAALDKQDYADVEIVLNLEEGNFNLTRDGSTTFIASVSSQQEAREKIAKLAGMDFAKNMQAIDATMATQGTSHSFKARIDRGAYYGFRENEHVRAIRLIGFKDTRSTQWGSDILAAAKASGGSADVLITLRGGQTYSPKSGFMSDKAWKAQGNAHQNAFNDILLSAGAPRSESLSSNHELGALRAKLSLDALNRLQSNADPRILSVSLNKPMATAALSTAMGTINMASAWNAGYRASGQAIIVMDSGIRKNHEFFKTNGTSKVSFEACFGSNGNINGNIYQSICPSPDANGDSPLNYPGSGEPWSNTALCNQIALGSVCSHGTNVAGIAAGSRSPAFGANVLQGVAPDANLISVQVFSYSSTAGVRPTVFGADLLAAMNAVYANTTSGLSNPFTVNLSLGSDVSAYTTNCPNADNAMTAAVQNLVSRGVPVVAATGNGGFNKGISWPGCIPQVIKVSSVVNNSDGNQQSDFANIANQAYFTGQIFLAPGGGAGTGVMSAGAKSTTDIATMAGTSQATPQLSGLYAAIKSAIPGISVADATAWIVGSGSIPVIMNIAEPPPSVAPAYPQTFRRIRIPNF